MIILLPPSSVAYHVDSHCLTVFGRPGTQPASMVYRNQMQEARKHGKGGRKHEHDAHHG